MRYTRISADCHIDMPWMPATLFTENASAEMKDRIKTLGFDMIVSSPEAFGVQLKQDVERWSDVVKRANVPVN